MKCRSAFLRDPSGTAGAEMALLLPLVTVILFGGIEMGHFFWTEHQVIKTVRNGTRVAARQPFGNFTCGADNLGAADDDVRAVVRTGTFDDTQDPVVRGWEGGGAGSDGITIAVICDDGSSYSQSGIYRDASDTGSPAIPFAMKVQITATVSYPSLFDDLGYLEGRALSATAESPVTGF